MIAATQQEANPQYVLNPLEWTTGLLFCLQPIVLSANLSVVVLLLAVWLLWRHARPLLWLSLLWTILFLVPIAVSPGPLHRYYLPQGGYCLVYAFGASASLSLLPRIRLPGLT
jgi:hypothetical protein